MSERIVDSPANHGWVETDDGRWVWDAASGGSGGGSIQNGDTVGQVTTWSGAEWTPDSSLTIDATGDATFTGTVSAIRFDSAVWRYTTRNFGLALSASNSVRPVTVGGTELDSTVSLGWGNAKFKDAYFSGTVDAGGFTVNGVPISGGGHSGNNLVIENPSAAENEKKWRFNINNSNGRFRLQPLNDDDSPQNADYIQFRRNNTIETVATITAPDFIATSDERAKDNITTAPVGLIDSLTGREWEWKESGEKGSGVVAQELEQVLPHLVHEDEDGMKSVSYMGLCAYLIEELKDCRERLAVLESKE